MDYDVQRLKNTQLDILDYIVGVCEKNGIDYCLFFGTLLGAYRHRGYIPWDDDLDIACRREDYERLLKALRNENDSRFYVQCYDLEADSPALHAKVRMNGTRCVERNVVSDSQNLGIFVDIFPLDYYSDDFKHRAAAFLIKYFYSVRQFKLFGRRISSLKDLIKLPFLPFSLGFINRRITRLLESVNKKQDFITCYICNYDAGRCSCNAQWFEETDVLEFENRYYKAPAAASNVLERLYGEDYMTLPPEDKRVTHSYQSVTWDE